jgi:hypothetical protein
MMRWVYRTESNEIAWIRSVFEERRARENWATITAPCHQSEPQFIAATNTPWVHLSHQILLRCNSVLPHQRSMDSRKHKLCGRKYNWASNWPLYKLLAVEERGERAITYPWIDLVIKTTIYLYTKISWERLMYTLNTKTSPAPQNKKTRPDALGTAENESGRAKNEIGTRRPRYRRKRVRTRKTIKLDPMPCGPAEN